MLWVYETTRTSRHRGCGFQLQTPVMSHDSCKALCQLSATGTTSVSSSTSHINSANGLSPSHTKSQFHTQPHSRACRRAKEQSQTCKVTADSRQHLQIGKQLKHIDEAKHPCSGQGAAHPFHTQPHSGACRRAKDKSQTCKVTADSTCKSGNN